MTRFFEDFEPGTVTYGGLSVSRDDIVAFARAYDPQPFHVDEVAARDTFLGTLVASGWHSCALLMRMLADHVLLGAASMGSPGIEEVRWVRPVRPGDTLRVRQTVVEARVSQKRPDRGLVRFHFALLNQADETVLDQTNWILFGRRDAAASGAMPRPSEAGAPLPARSDPVAATGEDAAFFEDLAIGREVDLGSHAFPSVDIIAFARAFDPQPFHVDPAAAERSHFGGLCASGWHTAAVWMKLMVAHRQRAAAKAVAEGASPPRLGPSPGFKDLRWSRPVYAGDTITYRSRLVDKRPSASRPGWGLVFHHNTGVNQHGEEAFSFRGSVFWERRPDA